VPTVTPNGDEYSSPYAPDDYSSHEIF
jgi:hypothetical protein